MQQERGEVKPETIADWLRTAAPIIAMIVGGTWALGKLPTADDVDRISVELRAVSKEIRTELHGALRERDETFERRVLAIVNDASKSRRFTADDAAKLVSEQDRAHAIIDKRIERVEGQVESWDHRLEARLDILRKLYGWTGEQHKEATKK